MILKLPPQCFSIILETLSNNDLLSLAFTNRQLHQAIMPSHFYNKIYYISGYEFPHKYKVINNIEQLKAFLKMDMKPPFEFVNLSDLDHIDVDGVQYDLEKVGTRRNDSEFYVPFKMMDFPQNYNDDYMKHFRDSKTYSVNRLSIVVKNSQTWDEYSEILQAVEVDRVQDLELIVVDNGNDDFIIFKNLLLFVQKFKLEKLSIMWFCHEADTKNNLRIILINSILLATMPTLSWVSIYLDIPAMNMSQLMMLYRQLSKLKDVDVEFDMKLNNMEIDLILSQDLKFAKNFISNCSIVVLLIEEFINIDNQYHTVFNRLNSNFKMSETCLKLDHRNKQLYSEFFLPEKLENHRHIKLFNIEYQNSKVKNIDNYNNTNLVSNLTNDLNDINSIFA